MKQEIAVRCAICSTLHGIADITYSVVWGGAQISVNQRVPLDFGTEDDPTIICASPECLQRLFKTIDVNTFNKIQALKIQVAKQVHCEDDNSDLGFGVGGIDYD